METTLNFLDPFKALFKFRAFSQLEGVQHRGNLDCIM